MSWSRLAGERLQDFLPELCPNQPGGWPRTKQAPSLIIMATPSGQGWFPQGTKAPWVKGWGVLPRRRVWPHPQDGSHPTVTLRGLWMQSCSDKMLRAMVGPVRLVMGWDLLRTHRWRRPAWRLFPASAWGWVRLLAAWPMAGCQGKEII